MEKWAKNKEKTHQNWRIFWPNDCWTKRKSIGHDPKLTKNISLKLTDELKGENEGNG
jgi:hypothetical protein